ncbi:hypothetical protein [Streptomyces herbicida]|uniref:hypothetical protein n=1 Tax=Streptomyces herbicida TaxID=3065675 RepID=UPI0029305A1B|nr:hypothetical protein [Streptomyces sp. NEAU-HV9]
MAETLPPAGIDLLDVERLLLTEAAEPPLPPQDAQARDRVWDMAVRANPTLFDGPVVACGGLEWTGLRILRLSWVRVTYRHYALRRVPGATALPSLFVNVVQPTDDAVCWQGGCRLLRPHRAAGSCQGGLWSLPRTGRGWTSLHWPARLRESSPRQRSRNAPRF